MGLFGEAANRAVTTQMVFAKGNRNDPAVLLRVGLIPEGTPVQDVIHALDRHMDTMAQQCQDAKREYRITLILIDAATPETAALVVARCHTVVEAIAVSNGSGIGESFVVVTANSKSRYYKVGDIIPLQMRPME